MKVWVDRDEWYPFWIIETENPDMPDFCLEIDLDEERYIQYEKAVATLQDIFNEIETKVK